jgi:hypothetical protein
VGEYLTHITFESAFTILPSRSMGPLSRRHRSSWRRLAVFATTCAVAAIAIASTPDSSAGGVARLPMSAGAIGCVTPDAYFVAYVDTMITSSDSIIGIAARASGNLPAGPVSSVTVVTDPIVCHQAAVASGLSLDVPDSLAFSTVSVLRIGPARYVVTPIGAMVGEFQTHLTFDTLFTQPPLSVWAI